MKLVLFLIIAVILIGISVATLLHILIKDNTHDDNEREQQREADNIRQLKKQLAELEARLRDKNITQGEYEAYKLDAERRLLNNLQSTSIENQDTPLGVIISVCMGVPILAALLYIALGTPTALDQNTHQTAAAQQQATPPQTMESALEAVKERLRRDPNDPEARFALGNIYYANQQFAEARDVFRNLFAELPDRPDVLLAYAEAQARTQNNAFKGIPLELVKRTLQLDPRNKKANWLLGVAAFQEQNIDGALAIWKKQLAREDNTNQERMMLERMIAQISAQATDKPSTSNTTQAEATVENTTKSLGDEPPHLTITAAISKKLRGHYKASDRVFIYAKAASGPAIPLAIFQTTAEKLPITLTLSDADAMTPKMKLSMFNTVVAIARISKSGDAITQSGDLQGQSAVISNQNQNISIEIDTIVP